MSDGFRIPGLAGVASHDGARAVRTWGWLQWVLLGFSLLAIPAFYFDWRFIRLYCTNWGGHSMHAWRRASRFRWRGSRGNVGSPGDF